MGLQRQARLTGQLVTCLTQPGALATPCPVSLPSPPAPPPQHSPHPLPSGQQSPSFCPTLPVVSAEPAHPQKPGSGEAEDQAVRTGVKTQVHNPPKTHVAIRSSGEANPPDQERVGSADSRPRPASSCKEGCDLQLPMASPTCRLPPSGLGSSSSIPPIQAWAPVVLQVGGVTWGGGWKKVTVPVLTGRGWCGIPLASWGHRWLA